MKLTPEITVQLVHMQGGMKGEIQQFHDPVITVGRLPSFTVHFPVGEPGVSREHARIERDGNRCRLIALKDKFGTFVNGRLVREAVLRNGDVIEFGSGGPKVSFSMEIGPLPVEPPLGCTPGAVAPEPVAAPGNTLSGHAPRGEMAQPHYLARGAGRADAQREKVELSQEKTGAPLIIQFGPTIRTYRECPVLIGAHVGCDFVLQHGGIQDRHAQILFSHGCYFVKDLTGQSLLSVNGRPSGAPVRLNLFDEIACGPQGPVFQFLGEGRLAEIEGTLPGGGFPPFVHDDDPGPMSIPERGNRFRSLLSRLVKGLSTFLS